MDSPPELTKQSSPSPTSPFTSSVITAPSGLLESSAIDESMAESMQDTMTGHSAEVEQIDQNPPSSETDGANTVSADLSSFTLADNENPIFITGDDGTVYQVAGQNEQGQTILLTQGKIYNFLLRYSCVMMKLFTIIIWVVVIKINNSN